MAAQQASRAGQHLVVAVSRILLLAGTAEARILAERLSALRGVELVSSLAGRVSQPVLPPGQTRIGGFGDAEGLAAYLAEHRISAVVDATHPFAAQVTAHAAVACADAGLPLLVLRRPGWVAGPGDDWRRVPALPDALAVVRGERAGSVLLTLGRRGPEAFAADSARHYVIRCVDPPDGDLPPRHTIVLDRGPFGLAGERMLLREHRVGLLVTRDSGGRWTEAKLVAARELGLPVVMIDRPPLPENVRTASAVADAEEWVRGF
jgi:precorrin-6A/cobalt-precorrin-6A reductase